MRSTRPQQSRSVCSGNPVLCARKYGFVGCFGRCEQLLVATRSSFSKGALQNDICRFESSMPSQPVRSLLFDFRVWVNHSPSDSSGKDRERHLSSIARLRHLRRFHHVVLWLLTSSNQNRRLASVLMFLIAFVSAVASHED